MVHSLKISSGIILLVKLMNSSNGHGEVQFGRVKMYGSTVVSFLYETFKYTNKSLQINTSIYAMSMAYVIPRNSYFRQSGYCTT